ncbi:MAG: RagB/SusD family nutrient uptake outer membrane protein [Bacteroidales bacterium]
MIRIKNILVTVAFVCAAGMLCSCSDFLGVLPKGSKIPISLADYEALLRDEYTCQLTHIAQSINLLNDAFVSTSSLNREPLTKANYFWDEAANRIELNNADEMTYYNSYAAISIFNLILESAPSATDCTELQRRTLIAQVKVLRSLVYFTLTNFYAQTYDRATAEQKMAVPLILSANVNTPYTQATIAQMYKFIIDNIKESITDLPEKSVTIIHPNQGSAYALLARVYLQQQEYDLALLNAEEALKHNSALYDWVEYYNKNKAQIENPSSYVSTVSPAGYDNVENYYYRHGSKYVAMIESNVLVERAARFEAADARFAAKYKIKTVGADTYYASTTRGFFNNGGITTPEVYLIKAECLARSGKLSEAMDALNTVRIKRILPAKYVALTASTIEEAITYIRRTKDNEMMFGIVAFGDARRYNKDPKYAVTLRKVVAGKEYTLSPTSHLWTMPFPMGAIKNSGNGFLVQNVEK